MATQPCCGTQCFGFRCCPAHSHSCGCVLPPVGALALEGLSLGQLNSLTPSVTLPSPESPPNRQEMPLIDLSDDGVSCGPSLIVRSVGRSEVQRSNKCKPMPCSPLPSYWRHSTYSPSDNPSSAKGAETSGSENFRGGSTSSETQEDLSHGDHIFLRQRSGNVAHIKHTPSDSLLD